MYHAKNYGSNNRIFPKHAYVQDSLLRVLSHSTVCNPTNLSGGIGQTGLWCNFHDHHQRAGLPSDAVPHCIQELVHLPAS